MLSFEEAQLNALWVDLARYYCYKRLKVDAAMMS